MTSHRTNLATLNQGAAGVVVGVCDDRQHLGEESQASLGRRLVELGFVAGERVEVVAQNWPSGDPMAVRVGNTTFALRRREAQAILVDPCRA